MSDESSTTDESQDRAARAAQLAAEAGDLFGFGRAEADDSDVTDNDSELGGVPVVAVVNEQGRDDADDDEDADDDGDDDDDVDDEDEVDQPAALPSFGLVFQAPDLSDLPRRRSRRATSSGQAPARDEGQHDRDEVGPEGAEAGGRDDEARAGQNGSADDDQDEGGSPGRRRRRGGKGRRGRGGVDDVGDSGGEGGSTGDDASEEQANADTDQAPQAEGGSSGSTRTRSRRGRGRGAQGGSDGQEQRQGHEQSANQNQNQNQGEQADGSDAEQDDASGTRRRRRRTRSGQSERPAQDEVTSLKGSTRLEAKRQRRREGREAGRRRTIITEAEFLARRESVERVMVVRGLEDRTQIAVLEDGVPVEHYVSRSAQTTMVGNVYLGRVQNVLPSMEAAFVDIGKGRNAVLYAGEVNWDAAGVRGNEPKRIENALKSGQSVLVQVTKDPIGHKGARLTSQVSLPGRFVVYVPGSSMTGISRKLPENERARLKQILKEVVPADVGVIVRTAAEGAAEAELRADVERLTAAWERIQARSGTATAPALLHGEPDMTVRVIRDVFNEDFARMVVSGEQAWKEVKRYVDEVAPDLADRVEKHTGTTDVFTEYRVHEAIAKAMDRKVWLPSGGSLVIDRTEAMTVVDVNTGKFTGSGGNLEETVTKNNIEAAEEIVRQLRLRDIGGIIVVDFIDMVLESNRDLVVRRLLECLGRDRTKHQVAEVTSLGLVQMTRKRVGSGLIEVFSETCTHCNGRGVHVHTEPTAKGGSDEGGQGGGNAGTGGTGRRGRGKSQNGRGAGSSGSGASSMEGKNVLPTPNPNGPTPAQIAAAAHAAAVSASSAAEAAAAGAAQSPSPVGAGSEVPATENSPPEASTTNDDAPAKKTTRTRRVATARSTTPPASDEDTPEKSTPATRSAPEQKSAPAQETIAGPQPAPAAAPEPEAAPKRRRRGRVVAPAGPPTGE